MVLWFYVYECCSLDIPVLLIPPLKKSAATLGNKASLAGLGLQYLKTSVVIVIFRYPHPPGKGGGRVGTRDGSHAGSDAV